LYAATRDEERKRREKVTWRDVTAVAARGCSRTARNIRLLQRNTTSLFHTAVNDLRMDLSIRGEQFEP
jgi:hypothetical protein